MKKSMNNIDHSIKNDEYYMALAIALAKKGLYTTDPNPRVGAVVVKNDQVIGEGAHLFAGQPHAEVYALQEAVQSDQGLEGATVYVTLEPCSHFGKTPPCAEALIKSHVSRVVFGMEDPNPEVSGRGIAKLRESGIQVDGPILEKETAQLNPGFIQRMRIKMPWVRCKLAMSLDGRTAMASGESQWITGADARCDVQKWRARSSAVLTGIGTVRSDNPSLNLRKKELGWEPERQPARILLDSHLSVNMEAKILNNHAPSYQQEAIYIVTTHHNNTEQDKKIQILMDKGIEIITLESEHDNEEKPSIPLKALLSILATKGMNEIMIESGSVLAGAFLSEDLLDELIIYMAPSIMGDQAKGLFHLPWLDKMKDKVNLDIDSIDRIGKDWRIIASLA